jgi:hypothetical protein
MDPDQPAHPRRIHAVRLQTLLQVEKLIANSMDPDQTGLGPCWSQTHYVGFVVTRLISFSYKEICIVMLIHPSAMSIGML